MAKLEDVHLGDVVRLNSGGPRMTVAAIPLSGCLVKCQWFSEQGRLHKGEFDIKTIEKWSQSSPRPPSSRSAIGRDDE